MTDTLAIYLCSAALGIGGLIFGWCGMVRAEKAEREFEQRKARASAATSRGNLTRAARRRLPLEQPEPRNQPADAIG